MKTTLLSSGGKSIGLEYIFSYLKQAGQNVDLIFDPSLFYIPRGKKNFFKLRNMFAYSSKIIDRQVKEVINSRPDLVGISVFSDTYGFACQIAQKIKEKLNVPIIFGGYHPSSVPEIVIQEECVDYVCIGEGEEAMLDLTKALEQGNDTSFIPNIWTKKNGQLFKNSLRPLLTDLDTLPFPGNPLTYKQYNRFIDSYLIIGTRGCAFNCTFCCEHLWKRLSNGSAHFRRRSVHNIMEELNLVKNHNHKLKTVWFGDPIFTYDLSWLESLCLRYKKEINLPFMCFSFSPYISEKALKILEDSNCVTVEMGIQTVSEKLRKNILNRHDTNQQIIKAIKLFQQSRVSLLVNILLNVPGQDEEELKNTVRFFSHYPPDSVSLLPLRYYPRTDIIAKAREENILSEEEVKKIEKSKEYTPFGIGDLLASKQMTDNKKIYRNQKLSNLINLSCTLHPKTIEWILKKKLYFKFLSLLTLYSLLVHYLRTLTRRKKKFKFFGLKKEFRFCLWQNFGNFPKIR
jgi:radical SAM superfamily enzyme YgiQ (UPF0313 family)